jgi:FtsH-binding integral membrane protein
VSPALAILASGWIRNSLIYLAIAYTKIVISSFWIMIEMQKLEEIKVKKDAKVRQG